MKPSEVLLKESLDLAKGVPRVVAQGVRQSEVRLKESHSLRYGFKESEVLLQESLDLAEGVPRVVAQSVRQSEVLLKKSDSVRYCLRSLRYSLRSFKMCKRGP